MIDVLVEASSPDLFAEIADLLRDHSQLRLIDTPADAAGGEESRPQPDVVLVATDADHPAPESFGWNAAGVPVILLVENPARRVSEALPAGVRAILPRNATPAEIAAAIEAVAAVLVIGLPRRIGCLEHNLRRARVVAHDEDDVARRVRVVRPRELRDENA